MRGASVSLSLALLVPLLSGCLQGGDGGDAATDSPFTREVRITIDQAATRDIDDPMEALQRLVQTSFTYTQGEGSLDVAGVTVRTVAPDGTAQERDLSGFTTKSTLEKGDTVQIAGVGLTSPIRFERNGQAVAERAAARTPWLQAAGVPLPFAASPGGLARYTLSSSGEVSLSFDAASYISREQGDAACRVEQDPDTGEYHSVCSSGDGSTTITVSGASFTGSASVTGTLRAQSSAEGAGGVRVRLDTDLRSQLKAKAEAQVHAESSHDGETETHDGPVGFDVDISGSATGQVGLGFGAPKDGLGGTLTSAGAGGSIDADGHIYFWQDQESKDAHQEPAGIEHPLLHEATPYTEEAIPGSSGGGMDFRVRDLLAALYDITLQPGDRFHLQADAGDGDGGFSMTYDLTVAARQPRAVGGQDRDALKLQGTIQSRFSTGGSGHDLSAFSFTYYVDAANHLPLLVDASSAQTLHAAELRPLLDLARRFGGEGVTFPDEMALTFRSEGRLEMAETQDGLKAAALLGGPGVFVLPVIAMEAMNAPMRAMASGSDTDRAPDLAFVKSDADSGVGGTLTVVSASSFDIPWSDLGVTGDADCQPPTDGFVLAGDEIHCASDGTVRIAHLPSNTLLYVGTF